MRKLVLGIALVVCLDIAFIWMMANQTQPQELSFAVAPHSAEPVVHLPHSISAIAIYDDVEPSAEVLEPTERVTRELRKTIRATRSRKNSGSAVEPIENPEFEDPSFTAKRLFPDKIIVIGQTETYIPPKPYRDDRPTGSDVSAAAVIEAARSERLEEVTNRSFESRAFGVIKKPYTWIRSLASKLR